MDPPRQTPHSTTSPGMSATEIYSTALYKAYRRSTDVIVAARHRLRIGRKAGSRSE